MAAIEFVSGPADHTPNTTLPPRIVEEAYRRGLLLMRAGLYSNCVRTLIPLIISDGELEEGLDVLEAAIAAATN
jgi:4-aminobutyrate aminotransferase/(S)-3-amino-2-methylpropionate transaminase